MSITQNRTDTAYSKIDKMLETETCNSKWFLTMDDIENKIKKDIDKYYDFCLYILEVCIPVTIEEKAVHKVLSNYMKTVPVKDNSKNK